MRYGDACDDGDDGNDNHQFGKRKAPLHLILPHIHVVLLGIPELAGFFLPTTGETIDQIARICNR